jgi:hypothetical protein
MVVIIFTFIEVATRATSLAIALVGMAYNKLYDRFIQPIEPVNYFPDLLEVSPWN